MSKPSNTAKAIQADDQAWKLRMEAYKVDRTYSPEGTRAQAHVVKVAERLMAQAELVQSVADHYGKKSMKED